MLNKCHMSNLFKTQIKKLAKKHLLLTNFGAIQIMQNIKNS